MGYWTSIVKRDGLKDLTNHPWAQLLKDTLAQVEPDTLTELEASGELADFLTAKVAQCKLDIRSYMKGGMEHQEAQELALADMLPKEREEPTDWEEEGALADLAAEFSKSIGEVEDAGSTENLDD
jgi:hypothetical protein